MVQIDLKNQQAIVTGAARGIGYSICESLLRAGAKVSAWDMSEESLKKAAKKLESLGEISTEVVDVTDMAQVDRAAQSAKKNLGSVDILVNNAGIIGPFVKTWEYDPKDFEKILDVNLHGVFLCSRAVIPMMLKTGRGRIVMIASTAGKIGTPDYSAYGASKAGVIALTKALGRELANTGILVNCITPSLADTDMLKEFPQKKTDWLIEQSPMGRLAKAEEIAAMAVWLCSDECSFSTGAVFDISGGRSVY
jgi:3-oxoacyl-[acyl-carrier protein] reductase